MTTRATASILRSACALGLAWLGTGCGGGPDLLRLGAAATAGLVNPAALRQAVSQGERARAPRAPPIALAVGASANELYAARLDRGPREAQIWRVEVDVAAAPVIVPGRVLFGAGDEIVALSSEDGRRLWSVPAGGATLLAATAGAELNALSFGDRAGRRWISVYDGQQRERLRVSAEAALGTPALRGTTLLVPFGKGELAAVDVSTASEIARAHIADGPVHALWSEGTLFFGGPPWIEIAHEQAEPYALPRRPLPGSVASGPLDPGAAGAPLPDVTRLYVRPRARGREPSDVYLATFGRIAFGLGRENGSLEWVMALPGRALSAAVAADGFVVCDDSGAVRLLDANTGRSKGEWPLVRPRRLLLGETALLACALSLDGALEPADGAGDPLPELLLEQLARVLSLSDPGLSEAQRFLARELAARSEPEATRVLIELVTRHSLDRVLQSEAEDLLATRRNGADYMLAALSDAAPASKEALPPIAPLGEALAALAERRAAPALARQLNRPAHTSSAIARAAAALEQLASETEYAELSVFFSLHRTNADGAEWVAAVMSSARTLLRIGGAKARALLQFATRDPLTVPEVRSALEETLASSTPATVGSQADLGH